MSSIIMNPHPRTLAEIAVQPIDSYTGYASCGCHQRGEPGRWYLCPYHLGVEEGWSEKADLINDLNDRIDRAIEAITQIPLGTAQDLHRLEGKIEGLKLVKDWLRSYE